MTTETGNKKTMNLSTLSHLGPRQTSTENNWQPIKLSFCQLWSSTFFPTPRQGIAYESVKVTGIAPSLYSPPRSQICSGTQSHSPQAFFHSWTNQLSKKFLLRCPIILYKMFSLFLTFCLFHYVFWFFLSVFHSIAPKEFTAVDTFVIIS